MNRNHCFRKIFILAFACLALLPAVLYSGAPEEVSGEINQTRAKVTGVGVDFVLLDDAAGFQPGDTVLVIQMKGVSIITPNNTNFGKPQSYIGDVGFYEFIVIQLVEFINPGYRITFYNNLKGGYDPLSFVQIIKVESYETLSVTGELTCPDWNSATGTGGVMALFASDKVELFSDINLSGKGFRGGLMSPIIGSCLGDFDDIAYFNESTNRAGRKGEGFASYDYTNSIPLVIDTYARGVGAIGTGGGSGDGGLSGGGGGSSYDIGGIGGEETGCAIVNPGGRGGWKLPDYYGDTTVIMGGGGGASGYTSGSAPDGGNGGGIVFIMTDSIYSYGGKIMVNGESALPASLTAGGAGGGAAGSVVISARGYGGSSTLNIEASGGNGSDAANGIGFGGGGSGGFIWLSPGDHSNVTPDTLGGRSGNWSGVSSSDGVNGVFETDLQMRLNGFLFNTVVTAKDGNLLDSICYGQVPRPLKASEPVGGTLPFTIYWEKSYNALGPWTSISGGESDYVFTPDQPETNTLWIRRRIVDNSSPTPIEDISKSVKVIVHPLIYDFEIDTTIIADTICYGQVPATLDPEVAIPGGGNGIYFYDWQTADNGTDWGAIIGSDPSYSPPSLTADAWYRRTVRSGACDTSSSVKFKVLPLIDNNIIGPDQTICEGDLFDELVNAGLPPGGGDGTFRYKWEASIDNIDFTHTIEGTADQVSYNPDELSADFPSVVIPVPEPKYYRRIVYSGENDCCIDISPAVSLVMQPAITGNNLTNLKDTICEGVPGVQTVIGTTPAGGDEVNYTYEWEERIMPAGAWTLNGSTGPDLVLASRIFSETTSFRRIVHSGVCDDTGSDEFLVIVDPMIVGNTISTVSGLADTVICSQQDPGRITGDEPTGGTGNYSYQWQVAAADAGPWNDIAGAEAIDYSPGTLTSTLWYRRVVFSEGGKCESTSNSVKIEVLPLISGNLVGPDQDICYGTDPSLLVETATLAGGDGTYYYLWESDTDAGFTSPVNEGSNPAFKPGILTLPTYYRRTVFSGLSDCCQDISNVVSVAINPLPSGAITPLQDEAICAGEDISVSLSVSSGTAPYNVTLNDGTTDQLVNVAAPGTQSYTITPVSGNEDRSFDYTLFSIVDANGCLATSLTGTKHVDQYGMPVADAGPDSDEECGFIYNLDAVKSFGTGTWSWDGPSTVFSDVNAPDAVVTMPDYTGGDRSFTFWWKEVNVLSRCVDSASTAIHFWKEPTVANAGNDSVLLPFQRDLLLYANQPEFGTGEWTIIEGGADIKTGDGNNPTGMAEGLSDGSNILLWTISNGVCDDSFDQIEFIVPDVRLISGFSPNNDGINDYFVIDGLVEWDGDVVNNELVVTDMTGVVMYRKENYGNDWDGRDMRGKPLPSGTYYYFINVYYSKKVQLKGFVIIKRD